MVRPEDIRRRWRLRGCWCHALRGDGGHSGTVQRRVQSAPRIELPATPACFQMKPTCALNLFRARCCRRQRMLDGSTRSRSRLSRRTRTAWLQVRSCYCWPGSWATDGCSGRKTGARGGRSASPLISRSSCLPSSQTFLVPDRFNLATPYQLVAVACL